MMLNLLSSKISFTGNFRRSGLPSFHCSARIGASDALNALNGLASVKESSTVISENDIPASASQSSSPVDAIADNSVQSAPPVIGKPKKNKLKSKKHADVLEETSDNHCAVLDGTELAGKKSKRGSHSSHVTRSEDVEGHCGHFPVDDLVEFIFTGRKLTRTKYKPIDDDEFSAVDQKSVAIKMRSSSSSVYSAMENDSGFGDLESSDRGDSIISEDSVSPTLLLNSESCEPMEVVQVVDTEVSITQAEDTKLGISGRELSSKMSGPCFDNTILGSELPLACLENDDITFESDFTVVRQKKRRSKPSKLLSNGDSNPSEQDVQPLRQQNGSSRSAVGVRKKINRDHLTTSRMNNSRWSNPDMVYSKRDIEVKTTSARGVIGGSLSGLNMLSISSNDHRSSNCSSKGTNEALLNETTSRFAMKRQVAILSDDRNNTAVLESENSVATSDVGTMTILNELSEGECLPLSEATCQRLSVDSRNRHLSSKPCSAEKDYVSSRTNSTEMSNSCLSTVPRTQSPRSSCDYTVVSESSVPPQVFDVNAAQSFLFKAFQDAIQMKKTHPHSVEFYRPEIASVDVAV